jgi:hypothetical protein
VRARGPARGPSTLPRLEVRGTRLRTQNRFGLGLGTATVALGLVYVGAASAGGCGGKGPSGVVADAGAHYDAPYEGGYDAPYDSGGMLPLDSDPAGDLDPDNGDPSLDIVGSGAYSAPSGGVWFRVVFDGTWKPAPFYSYFCRISLYDANGGTSAELVTELHDGVESLIPAGVDLANVTYVVESKGFRVHLAGVTPPPSYGVQAGMIQVEGDPYVEDLSGPHDLTGEAEFSQP